MVGFVCLFKQKTAYEIEYGLVGSEMCIRDRQGADLVLVLVQEGLEVDDQRALGRGPRPRGPSCRCLLYTSAAADERSSVDLGGRRIIKKNTSTYRRAN